MTNPSARQVTGFHGEPGPCHAHPWGISRTPPRLSRPVRMLVLTTLRAPQDGVCLPPDPAPPADPKGIQRTVCLVSEQWEWGDAGTAM